ncbi:MAG TPA: O-antigen ligase family protein [Ktedonobacteraceae bacterium]|nr:O-antigen ligase family protein [Ktedonobacteraceae bacterium]
MNIPGTGGIDRATRPLASTRTGITFDGFRQYITTSNLIGLIGALLAIFLLLAPPAPWNIRLPLYLVVLGWTILRPRTALYLLPLAIPWGSLDYITLAGLRVDSADILVAFLAAGWLLSYALPSYMAGPRDRTLSHIPAYLVLATLALLSVMFLSVTVALNKSDSLKEISKWLEFLLLLVIGAQYIRTRRQLWTMIIFICLAAISQAFYGYIQYLYNIGPEAFVRDASLRVYGTFDQPNPFAGYINMPLSIVLAVALLGRGRLTRILAGTATILLGIVVYLTQSRGGEMALATALVFIILVGMPQIRTLMRVGILAIFAFVEALLAGFIPLTIFNPILHILGLVQISLTQPTAQDYSTAERLAHWIAGLHMYFAHPILGVGIGNYPDAYPQYFITIFTNSLGHAHNYYINIAAETGSIGLIVYILFLLAIFIAAGGVVRNISRKYALAKAHAPEARPAIEAPLGTRNKLVLLLHPVRMMQHYRRQNRFKIVSQLANDRALAIGLFAALLTVCVHNIVDDLYVHSLTSLIALLLIALIRLERVTSAPMD